LFPRHPPPPLVTLDEIENAENLCPHKPGACNILVINHQLYKKSDLWSRWQKLTPILVRKRPHSCSKSHECIYDPQHRFYLNGKYPRCSSDTLLKSFTMDSKRTLIQQLEAFTHDWRQVEGSFFGTVDGGPCEDVVLKHPWDLMPGGTINLGLSRQGMSITKG
jgi:hypothetical protein